MAGYTLLRQDDDVRKSGAYTDTTVASLANWETNPTDLEGDLNILRSAVHLLLKNQAGNWYDGLNTPVTLDTGTARGVNDINSDLHALERKRVLVAAMSLADITVAASVAATGTLTSTGAFSDGETATIGSVTYTFRTPFVDAANNINAAGTVAQTHENLRRAINLQGVAGTNYGTGTVIHPTVSAADTATTNVLTAKKGGTFGNTIVTTDTGANISFGAATLTGGSGGDVAILGVGQLPPNTTAAVGAVTTRGTVVAGLGGSFGTASLTEVAGSNAIAPKSIVEVVNGSTRDPILSGGYEIYALLQGEPGLADGDTILDAGSDRVQVTFVRVNSTGDDLETIDGADLGGVVVNLAFTERKALEDLTEQDFLRGAVTDVPSSATVSRQSAYDNQGTTPVDVTTNSTLDLEGAGLIWEIRDDLQATLFRITEGSAGGTSVFLVGGDVDTFDVNAVDNDFLNGATFGTTGTGIQVAETAGVIERAADLIVRASGAGELYLDDSNQPGSWAQVAGVKLSDTSTEWSNYETAFGGEVSLLNAIVQAYNAGANPLLTFHEVTANTAADNDVSGPSGANNVDVDFPDLSTGTFTLNHWLFLNGRLMRPGANAAANYDYYPGTALTPDADIRFERAIKNADVIAIAVF